MIPIEFKPFLWSYDFDKLDKNANKEAVISAILNYGTYNTFAKLFETYTKDEIKSTLSNTKTDWNKRSYNFWNLILN